MEFNTGMGIYLIAISISTTSDITIKSFDSKMDDTHILICARDTHDIDISDNDITKYSMRLSTQSFSEYWDDENDDYWSQY